MQLFMRDIQTTKVTIATSVISYVTHTPLHLFILSLQFSFHFFEVTFQSNMNESMETYNHTHTSPNPYYKILCQFQPHHHMVHPHHHMLHPLHHMLHPHHHRLHPHTWSHALALVLLEDHSEETELPCPSLGEEGMMGWGGDGGGGDGMGRR